jgi:hypothetical protein
MSPNSQNSAPKQLRWKVVLPLLAAGLAIAIFAPRDKARALAQATRQELRAQGFKLDLDEFNLAASATVRSNGQNPILTGRQVRGGPPYRDFDLMRPVTKTSALVLWNEDKLWSDSAEDSWPTVQNELDLQQISLDAACRDLSEVPFRFDPSSGPMGVRFLVSALATRAVLDLHNSNRKRAFTNLFALARVVSSWQPEPLETAWMLKFRCVTSAERAMWQALQTDTWIDSELLALQREWARPEFFSILPETAALARATLLDLCARTRQAPPARGPSFRQIASELFTSPDRAWADLTSGMRQSSYRAHGSYEDEVAIMLCFRERELDLRRAIKAATWAEMSALPGVTNPAPFKGDSNSMVAVAVNNRPFNFASQRGASLPSRAAEAETRRRLTLCALALKRYRLAHNQYPAMLAQLVPEFLQEEPLDFMDGRPLRYRLVDENTFQLYSVGLNGLDDQGQMTADLSLVPRGGFGVPDELDLAWPRPASPAEVEVVRTETERRRHRFDDVQSPVARPVRSPAARIVTSANTLLSTNTPAIPPAPSRRSNSQ